jgi:ABC-type multidrug transport system fused ATPase/permease subunit
MEIASLKSLKFVFQYMRKYAGVLFLTVVSMLLLVGVQLLAPWIIKLMVATVTDATSLSSHLDLITQLALFALLIFAARAFLQFVRSYMAHLAGWGVVADVRSDVYGHLQRLSLRFYENMSIL